MQEFFTHTLWPVSMPPANVPHREEGRTLWAPHEEEDHDEP